MYVCARTLTETTSKISSNNTDLQQPSHKLSSEMETLSISPHAQNNQTCTCKEPTVE
uniref:Uncharacterized protein n=1 Tax=Arion vulgaris TaxID=1028688 RepID=A0A0B6ZHL0_9EUPU